MMEFDGVDDFCHTYDHDDEGVGVHRMCYEVDWWLLLAGEVWFGSKNR